MYSSERQEALRKSEIREKGIKCLKGDLEGNCVLICYFVVLFFVILFIIRVIGAWKQILICC